MYVKGKEKVSDYYSIPVFNAKQSTTRVHVVILDATLALEKNTFVTSPPGVADNGNQRNGRF
jgi:hypothetical protein